MYKSRETDKTPGVLLRSFLERGAKDTELSVVCVDVGQYVDSLNVGLCKIERALCFGFMFGERERVVTERDWP